MQLEKTLAVIALIPLYGFGIGLHLDLIDTGEMFGIENFVKNADMEFQSNSLFSNAYLSENVEGLIGHASISFDLAKVLVDPNEQPNSGDEYFDNLITECRFHSDESFEGNTCVLCELVDPEISETVAKGIIELPDGYIASDKVTIKFDEPADVMEAKAIKIKVVPNEIVLVDPPSGDTIVNDDTNSIIKVDPVTEIQTNPSQDGEFHEPANVVLGSNVDTGVIITSTEDIIPGTVAGSQVTLTKTPSKLVIESPGELVDYEYKIENTGINFLVCDTIFDDSINPGNDLLASSVFMSPGDMHTFTVPNILISDTTTNEAIVSCRDDSSPPAITDSTTATVKVVDPSVTLGKTVSVDQNTPTSDTSINVADMTDVFYTFTATNTGDTPLTNCQVNDPLLGGNVGLPFDLPDGTPVTVTSDAHEILFGDSPVVNQGTVSCDVEEPDVDSTTDAMSNQVTVTAVGQRSCEEIFAMDE